MTKNFLSKIVSAFLVLSIVAPPVALAQSLTRQAMQELAQERKDEESDKNACLPKKPGASSLAYPARLEKIIGSGLQKKLSQTLRDTVSQKLKGIIGKQLGQKLPDFIERGLKEELPGVLREKLRSVPAADRNARGPQLLEEAVREVLPGIIQNGLPGMLKENVGRGLQQELTAQFQSQMSDLLQNSQFFMGQLQEILQDPVAGLMTLINSAIPQLVSFFFGQIANVANNVPALLQGNFSPISATTSQAVRNNIFTGVVSSTQAGVAEGSGVERMVQQMMPLIMRTILPGIMRNMPTAISGGLNQFGSSGFQNASSGFDFNAWAGNNITAAVGFDLAPVSEAIARPLALATVSGLSIPDYDTQIGNLAALGYQGEPTVNALRGAELLTPEGADYAYRVGYIRDGGPLTPEIAEHLNSGGLGGDYPDYVDLDFNQPGIADAVGADAAGAINPNDIGSNSVVGLGSQIGNGLKGGLANGISGGLGNLVDGIPYIGGLLSPIAEDMVQVAMENALGMGAGGGLTGLAIGGQAHAEIASKAPIPIFGFATSFGLFPDPASGGLAEQLTAIFGVSFSNLPGILKNTGKIDSQTKQSNENEDRDFKEQGEQKQVQISNCLKNKSLVFSLRNLETVFRVLNPGGWAGSMILTAAAIKNFQNFKQTAAPERFGGQNGEGKSIIADPAQNQAEASEEAYLTIAYRLYQTGDPELGKIADNLVRASQSSFSGPTMSYDERENFRTGATNMSQTEYLQASGEYWGKNDPASLELRYLLMADKMAAAAEEQARSEFLAYGRNAGKECLGWVTVRNKQVCVGGWITQTPGDTYKARDNFAATADLLKLAMAQGYKQDSVGPLGYLVEQLVGNGSVVANDLEEQGYDPCPGLGPCNPSEQYREDGYVLHNDVNTGLIDQYSFGANLDSAFGQVLTDGLGDLGDQVEGWTEDQIGGLADSLFSGLRNSDYGYNDFNGESNFERDNAINLMVTNALIQAGLPQHNQIIEAIVQMLIEKLTELAHTILG